MATFRPPKPVLEGYRTEKSATPVINGASALFTVSSGRILLTNLFGEVTTGITGTLPTLKAAHVSTVGGDIDLSTATLVTADEVGTLYALDGVGNALETGSSGVVESTAKRILMAEGTITMVGTATDVAGAVAWTALWVPVDSGAALSAA